MQTVARSNTRRVTAHEAAAIRYALAVAANEARAYAASAAPPTTTCGIGTDLTFDSLRLAAQEIHQHGDGFEDHCSISTGEKHDAAVSRLSEQGFPYLVSSYKSGNVKSPKLFRKMPKCEIKAQKYSKQFVFHIGTARIRFEAKIDLKKYQNFWNASEENMRASLSDWAVFTNSTSVKFVGDQGRVTMSKSLAMKIAQDYMELVAPVLYITRTGQGAAVKKFAEQPTAQQRLAWALCADALRLCGHSMYNRP